MWPFDRSKILPMDTTTDMPPDEQKIWRDKGATIEADQIKNVRASATAWASTIGTVTGVSAVVTLLTQRDTISKLAAGYQIALALLFGLSALCAIAAVYRGARAATGNLTPTGSDPRSLRYAVESEPLRTIQAIQDSKGFALLSALLLLVGIYVTWIGASSHTAPTVYLLPGARHASYCGPLITDAHTGQIALDPGHNLAHITIVDPATLTKIDACP